MLNAPTTEKLQALRLPRMLAAWQEQGRQADVTGLGSDERFALLVEAEWLRRENERLVRTLPEAKLRLAQATLEDFDYTARRGLDRAQVRQLFLAQVCSNGHSSVQSEPCVRERAWDHGVLIHGRIRATRDSRRRSGS